MKVLALAVGFVLFGLTLSSSLSAGDAKDQSEAAMRLYRSGDLQRSVSSLNDALATIHEERVAEVARLFPEPLPGWHADPPRPRPQSIAALVGANVHLRHYFRDDGAEITLSFLPNSPLLPLLEMALPAPGSPQSRNGPNAFSLKGYRGTIKQYPEGKRYAINLFVDNWLMIQARGIRLPDPEPLEKYLQSLDIDAILKVLSPVDP